MKGHELLLMRDYLKDQCLQYDDAIHVMVAKRKAGKKFSLSDHIAGLIYAQLTNQTKWSRIVPHLKEIDQLFFSYDVDKIKTQTGDYFANGIFALKCGNISTKAQMRGLQHNIEVMEKLIKEYGSMDAFVLSAPAYKIVEVLSAPKSKYKLAMMGEALTWEYVRNVGIDACKPDTHLRRFLGSNRMGAVANEIASIEETIEQVESLALETGLTLCAVDNIIWSYCADGYGEVCTATPRCEMCVVKEFCAKHKGSSSCEQWRSITYEELKRTCSALNNDPCEIGRYILKMLER